MRIYVYIYMGPYHATWCRLPSSTGIPWEFPVPPPVVQYGDPKDPGEVRLVCEIKGLKGYGKRTASGFVVFRGSQAVSVERPSAATRHPFVLALRQQLLESGALAGANGHLQFTRDAEFPSPSAAAAVIQGGGANGLTAWRTETGQTLKELEQ